MLRLTRPRYFIPVHGEYRHLRSHALLATETGVPADHVFLIEDGTGLEVTKDTARVVPGFPVGRVLVDGKGVGDIGTVVLRDRQVLSEDGVIAVAIVVDASGTIVAGPDVTTRGVVYVRDSEALLEELRAAIAAALAARRPDEPRDRDALGAHLRTAARQFIRERFQRKPVVLPIVMEV
jgi:ribonuclease J